MATDPASIKPWRVSDEYERVIVNGSYEMIGSMDTPEAARGVVEVMNAPDVDARQEVTRLSEMIEHYRHRTEMSPSDRQHYFGENVAESIEPEGYYQQRVISPVNSFLHLIREESAGVHLGNQSAEQALTAIVAGIEKLHEDTTGRLKW